MEITMRKLLPFLLALPLFAQAEPSLNATQKQQVKDLIAETLKTEPKLIINAIVDYRKQQMLEYQKAAEQKITENAKAVFEENTELVLGNPKAKLTIVEFMDYNCGHCKNLAKTLENILETNKDVRVVVKDLPIFGESSMIAAKAAYAAAKQNQYAKFHYAAILVKEQPNKANMTKVAQNLGLNLKQFQADFDNKATVNYIKANIELAKKIGIMATPAMIIGTQKNHTFIAGAAPAEQISETLSNLR